MRRLHGYEPVIWLDGSDVRHNVSSCVFVPQTQQRQEMDGSFTEYTTGWVMEIEAVQSLDESSLWRALWDRSGEVVSFRYAGHGNTVPSKVSPHLVGTVRFGSRPSIGGESQIRGSHSFSATLSIVTGPELVTA